MDTPATLICGTNLTGYPGVTVEWRDNNGETVTDDGLQSSFASGTDEISLVINKTRLDDSGRWLCVLTNTVGTKEVGIDLQVGCKCEFLSCNNYIITYYNLQLHPTSQK